MATSAAEYFYETGREGRTDQRVGPTIEEATERAIKRFVRAVETGDDATAAQFLD